MTSPPDRLDTSPKVHPWRDGRRWHIPDPLTPCRCAVAGCEKVLTWDTPRLKTEPGDQSPDHGRPDRVRETDVENYLLTQCRSRGFLCLKFISPSINGVPDRILVSPAQTLFVEVKRPGGTPRRLQAEIIDRLRRAGGVVHVVDTFSAVDGLMRRLERAPVTAGRPGGEETS